MLTEKEMQERERLLDLQQEKRRFFSEEEFKRLKELTEKMLDGAGSPHDKK